MGALLLAATVHNLRRSPLELLLDKVEDSKKKLIKFRDDFSKKENSEFIAIEDSLEIIELEVQEQISWQEKYYQVEHRIFNSYEKLDLYWPRLGKRLETLLMYITGIDKTNYNRGDAWIKTNQVVVMYEVILDELTRTIDNENAAR